MIVHRLKMRTVCAGGWQARVNGNARWLSAREFCDRSKVMPLNCAAGQIASAWSAIEVPSDPDVAGAQGRLPFDDATNDGLWDLPWRQARGRISHTRLHNLNHARGSAVDGAKIVGIPTSIRAPAVEGFSRGTGTGYIRKDRPCLPPKCRSIVGAP